MLENLEALFRPLAQWRYHDVFRAQAWRIRANMNASQVGTDRPSNPPAMRQMDEELSARLGYSTAPGGGATQPPGAGEPGRELIPGTTWERLVDPTVGVHSVRDRVDAATTSWTTIESLLPLVLDIYRKHGGPGTKPQPSLSRDK